MCIRDSSSSSSVAAAEAAAATQQQHSNAYVHDAPFSGRVPADCGPPDGRHLSPRGPRRAPAPSPWPGPS
eukprot:12597685-Alexandrium_andersonii.AAC.1